MSHSTSNMNSSSSTTLVSTNQRAAILKSLSKALRTRTFADLQRYLSSKGDKDAVVYQLASTGQWFVEETEHLGTEALLPTALLTFYAINGCKRHVQDS